MLIAAYIRWACSDVWSKPNEPVLSLVARINKNRRAKKANMIELSSSLFRALRDMYSVVESDDERLRREIVSIFDMRMEFMASALDVERVPDNCGGM